MGSGSWTKELGARLSALELEVAVLVEGTVAFTDALAIRTLAARVSTLEKDVETDAKLCLGVNVEHEARLVALEHTVEGFSPQTGAASHSEASRGSDTTRDPAGRAAVNDARNPQDAPSTASPAGDVPEWLATITDDDLRAAFMATASSETAWAAVRRLIASRAPRPAPQPSVEEMAERLYGVNHHVPLDLPWTDLGTYIKSYWLSLARAALSALPASEEKHTDELLRESLEREADLRKCIEEYAHEVFNRRRCPHKDCGGELKVARLECCVCGWDGGPGHAASEATKPEPLPPVSRAGETPTWKQMCDAVKEAETAWAREQFAGKDTPLEEVQNAAVRSLMLASRAPSPSIEDVVDALLRVTPYKSSYETGASGLVYRADVEQVMRALFDRRSK